MSRAAEPSKRQARGPALNDAPESPADCANCVFWRRLREHEGDCRRRAPEPAPVAPNRSRTGRRPTAINGAATAPSPRRPRRARLAPTVFYWRHPEGGLNPVDRGDMPMAWWALRRLLRAPRAKAGFRAGRARVLARHA